MLHMAYYQDSKMSLGTPLSRIFVTLVKLSCACGWRRPRLYVYIYIYKTRLQRCRKEAAFDILWRGVCRLHVKPLFLPNDISTPSVRADSSS